MKTVVGAVTWPLLMMGSVTAVWWGFQQGLPPAIWIASVITIAALIVLGLQQWIPYSDDWRGSPRDWSVDIPHMLTQAVSTDFFRALTFGFLFKASAWFSLALGGTLWPHHLPIVAQLALALLIGDFFQYWMHRGMHAHPVLWRLHAMHHSSEKLYVFASGRTHPLNVIAVYGVSVAPLVLLGANVEVLGLLTIFTGVNGMLQHANLDLKLGPLNWIIATVDLHRWHHSADFDESNTNMGSNLIVWDIVFGTRFLPEDRPHPEELGLGAGMNMPDNILQHLASPFILERFSTDEVPMEEVAQG